jgi:hypothetical protein
MGKSGLVPLLITLLGLRLGGESPRPVKLQVDLPSKSVSVGERATMNVHLVDADNRPVPAPKDFTVDIIARLPSNATETLASAVLKAGQSSMRVELPPAKTEGFVYIWAKQPELRLGGAYLRVKPPTRSQPGDARPPRAAMPPPAEPPRAQPSPGTRPQTRVEVEKRVPLHAIPVAKLGQMKLEVPRPGASVAAVATAQPAPPPSPASSAPPVAAAPAGSFLLALRYSPQRAFLANGKDPVTVHAFVMAEREATLPGFRIRLFDSTGTMQPVPLMIPPGEEEGTATLTSDQEGQVKVEYLGAAPAVDLDGEKVMTVSFEPPIVGFQLTPSPPRISLVDACDLVIRLVDERGTPLATKARRTVSLVLKAGRGEFSATEVPIEPGSSSAHVTFTPVWWGPVTLAASTPNLVNVDARLDVDPPLALLGFSLTGGLLGGYVFMLKRRTSKRWRIPLGALTGVILLWACLFLSLGVLPRAVILNPLSVFVISVIGGWLGTGVFEPILKRLGFEAAAKA